MHLAFVRFEQKRLLNSTLALKTSKQFIQLGEHKDFTAPDWAFVSVYKFVKCLRVTPTLFDGDYFWHTKHDASQSGIILLLLNGLSSYDYLHDKFKTFHCYEATKPKYP